MTSLNVFEAMKIAHHVKVTHGYMAEAEEDDEGEGYYVVVWGANGSQTEELKHILGKPLTGRFFVVHCPTCKCIEGVTYE